MAAIAELKRPLVHSPDTQKQESFRVKKSTKDKLHFIRDDSLWTEAEAKYAGGFISRRNQEKITQVSAQETKHPKLHKAKEFITKIGTALTTPIRQKSTEGTIHAVITGKKTKEKISSNAQLQEAAAQVQKTVETKLKTLAEAHEQGIDFSGNKTITASEQLTQRFAQHVLSPLIDKRITSGISQADIQKELTSFVQQSVSRKNFKGKENYALWKESKAIFGTKDSAAGTLAEFDTTQLHNYIESKAQEIQSGIITEKI